MYLERCIVGGVDYKYCDKSVGMFATVTKLEKTTPI